MPTLIQFSVGIFYGHGWPVCRQRRSRCRVVVGDAMDGLHADNAGRLHGCRRYASMDGCGRTASGTAVESNAGAVAGFYPAGQLWMSQAVRLLSRIASSIRNYSACTLTAILNST